MAQPVIEAAPRIDALRAKMTVIEDKPYSRDYLGPDKRSIANAVQVFFKDGTKTDRIEVPFPLGHRRSRKEGIPIIQQRAATAFTAHYGKSQSSLASGESPTIGTAR